MRFIVTKFLAFGLMVFAMVNTLYGQVRQNTTSNDTTIIRLDPVKNIPAIAISSVLNVNGNHLNSHSSLPLLASKGFIRSQGVGQIASISFRGLSSRQSDLRWAGFSIQSPTGISTDFGQIPWKLFSNASVSNETNNSGENGIGGAINLSMKPETHTSYFLSDIEFGSFGQQSQHFVYVDKRDSSTFKIGYANIQAKNNFLLPSGIAQKHAESKANAIVSNYRINHKNSSQEVNLWLQRNQINIPASLIESASTQKRLDYDARISHRVNFTLLGTEIFIKHLVNAETDQFMDSVRQFNSNLRWLALKHHLSLKKTIRGYTHLGLNFRRSNAWLESPQIDHTNSSLFINSIKFEADNSESFRQVVYGVDLNMLERDGQTLMLPSAKLKCRWDKVNVQLNIQRRGRFPLLSDLYWNQPGFALGNPNLKPEKMWVQEISTEFLAKRLGFNLTGFHQFASSMINWLNIENGISIPNNENNIRSLGFEFTGFGNVILQKNNALSVNYSYQFTKATEKETKSEVLFTPEHRGNISVQFRNKQNVLTCQTLFQSQQNLNVQGSRTLDGYQLLNASYTRQFPEISSELSFRIENITNHYYELIPFYPMPGRSFHIQYQYKLYQNES